MYSSSNCAFPYLLTRLPIAPKGVNVSTTKPKAGLCEYWKAAICAFSLNVKPPIIFPVASLAAAASKLCCENDAVCSGSPSLLVVCW